MSLATATRNGGVAFVKIAACDEHEVLSSWLVVEDALGVATRGWSDGFDVDVLDTRWSNRKEDNHVERRLRAVYYRSGL